MLKLIKDFLCEPIVVSNYYLKFICIFITVFIFIVSFFFLNIKSPVIDQDTPGYFQGEIKNPWSTYRTPGLRIYAKIIGVDFGDSIDKDNMDIDKLNKIVNVNIFLYAITIALLICSLCKIVPPVYIIILLIMFCYGITKIPNPCHILADPLAFIFSVAFLNSCIGFYRNKSLILLFIVCLLAICGFLTKPACCFMPMIATIMCICELFKKNKRTFVLKSCILTFLIAGTLSWPFWIYINGRIFVVSQLSAITNSIFMLHFLENGDEFLFKDDIDRKFILHLLEEKKEQCNGNIKPTIINYIRMRNIYGFYIFERVMNEIYGKEFSLYERAVFCKRICSPIIKKHRHEYIIHIYESVNLSFTILSSHIAIFIWNKFNSIFLLVYWRNISFICIFIGVLVGWLSRNKNYSIDLMNISRIICICVLIHVCHIVVTSIGHFVMYRYIQITEWSFVLGVYLSIYNFLYFLVKNLPSPRRRRKVFSFACA